MTNARIVDLWRKFLLGYQIEHQFYYFQRLQNLQHLGLKTLYLDYDHLVDAIVRFVAVEDESQEDKFNHLRKMVLVEPDEARETLREAAFNILKEVNLEYAESIEKTFRAEFLHAPIEKEMTALNIDDGGKFLKTTGFVTEYDQMSSTIVHYIAWRCPYDHITQTVTPDKPKKCTTEECGAQNLVVDDQKSMAEDFIRFKVQQRSDRVAGGKEPAIMEMETIGPDNVNFIKEQMKFGQYVGISGIVRMKFSRRSSGQGKSLGDPYIEASSIETLPDSYLIADDPDYGERVKFTIRHGSIEEEEEDLKKVVRSMFPSIHLPENDILKEICLMQLVGSDPLILPDGSRIRGEIQLLVLGDPGIAKSRIAEFYRHARKRVMYNSAGKSSTVGLVGGMKMDRDGRWQIASGVFGLAGDGIVILDEFASRTEREYADLLEPMSDSQSISIAKGASYRQETVNTAVLCIANAATFSRYYDTTKNIYENTKIPPTMLQRMDAILIRKDIADPKEDEAKARHFFEMQAKAVTEKEYRRGDMANVKRADEDFYPVGYVAKWLADVRMKYHPRFTDNQKAVEMIISWYLKWRKFSITLKDPSAKDAELGGMVIPGADMRRLASVMRFSNAHARACQRDFVEERDVEWAIKVNELTQAEAGVWKQAEDGSKRFMKDELAAHHQLMADRAARKEREIFENVIDKLSWIKCDTCHGSGEDPSIGEEEVLPCGDCEARGWNPQEFTKNDAISELVEIRRPPNQRPWLPGRAFEIIWAEKEKKLEIVATDYGRFRNTTKRQARETRTSSNKMMSADEMRKQALRDEIARRSPTRAERLLKE